MSVEIRPISGDAEARLVQRIGRRAFHPFLGMLVPRPKWGFAAWEDGTCLGGVILKQTGSFGLVDFIFVAASGRGRGLGKRLIGTAMEAFAERGLEHAAASVRDDNTASWNLFAGRGFRAYAPSRVMREFGLGAWLSLALGTAQLFAFGFDLWIGRVDRALRPDAARILTEADTVPGSSISTVFVHYALHAVAVTAALWRYEEGVAAWALAVGILLTSRLLISYLATLPFFRPARIRMARGGHITDFILNAAGTFFFYPAYWHPKKTRWRESDVRTGLGVSALFGSMTLMGLIVASSALLDARALGRGVIASAAGVLIAIGKLALVIDLQPIFEAWSGPRILRWNVWGYVLALCAGVAILLLA